jgi:chromosome segregation protein
LDERRTELETERHRLVAKLEELEDIRRRHEARKNLLDARRRDIEETPGSRFLQEHEGRALGLLKDLVKVESGLERALVAALGPLADAVVYAETDDALEDAPEGDGAILAISLGGPVPLGLKDERRLLAAVEADPAARGIVSTILRNVYLAESLAAASAKQTAHPNASFVTADGVLVGPAVIHTAREADARAREIRAELQVVAHDLAATVQAMKPKRERLDEVAAEVASLQERIDEADAAITAAAERLARGESDRSAMRKEEELLRQRSAALAEAAETARDRLEALGPLTVGEAPELPPIPQPPVRQRVAVETLRQTRGSHEARLSQLRSEQENLRAHDPSQLRADLTLAEEAKEAAELAVRTAEEIVTQAEEVRTAAAEAERAAAEREAEVNKAWRDASTALDELRERYEDQDRLRDDIERRIREAERLLREGHDADPTEILATLADDDTIETLERRSELVQRRLGLLGRVNLLATGELEQVQERYDFLQRELDDVHAARRDLHEVIARVDREITETFVGAFEDVSREYQRLIAELFPGGEGRLILTDPTDPLTAGIEIEANPGRKRVKRISLLSGGERSLAAMAFLFAIFTARPSPFYLMDEVEPALDDVNLHRFLRLVDGFAKTSQVIIVTHQKRTMEIAGMMYGVSLGADGTTKVVAQRLEQDVDLGRDSRLEGSAAGEPPVDATVG